MVRGHWINHFKQELCWGFRISSLTYFSFLFFTAFPAFLALFVKQNQWNTIKRQKMPGNEWCCGLGYRKMSGLHPPWGGVVCSWRCSGAGEHPWDSWCSDAGPQQSSASSDIHLLPQQLQTEPSYVAHPAGIALWLILCPRYFPNCYCMSVAVAWVSTFFFVSIDNRLCREQIARIKKSSVWSILETWKVSRQGELRVSCAAWWGLNRSRAALRSVWCLW